MAPPALGTPASRSDLRCERLDGHQQSFPCSRLNPIQPDNFSLDVQYRTGGVQLLLQPSHFRHRACALRAEGVALGGLPSAFARGQALTATPHAAPCAIAGKWELYIPSRRSSRPTSPGCKLSASSSIRSRYGAKNLRRHSAWPRPPGPALAARRSLRPWGPRRHTPRPPGLGGSISCNGIDSLSAVIRYSFPPPYSNSQGGPVSQ